jgi:hypothetical protein
MLTLLNVLSTGSAIFLSFLVLTVRREVNIIANRWLALFLLLLSSALFDGNLKIYGFAEEPYWLILLLNFNFLVLAPTLYLCIAICDSQPKLQDKRPLAFFAKYAVDDPELPGLALYSRGGSS